MAIIYKYTNKINGKSYIGQTLNPSARHNGHKSIAFNTNSKSYYQKFYMAIREYGWDSFEYEILEECDVSILNDREAFFIQKYDSVENGYNTKIAVNGKTWTDEMRKYFSEVFEFQHAALDYDEVVYIREAYLNGKKPSEIYPEFSDLFTHYYSFMNVWTGSRYGYVMPEVFQIRPNRVKLDYEKAQEIRVLREEGLTYAAIAEIYGVGKATIRDVIRGHTWKLKEPVSTISG